VTTGVYPNDLFGVMVVFRGEFSTTEVRQAASDFMPNAPWEKSAEICSLGWEKAVKKTTAEGISLWAHLTTDKNFDRGKIEGWLKQHEFVQSDEKWTKQFQNDHGVNGTFFADFGWLDYLTVGFKTDSF
jgi:hypothetical protein